MLRPGRLCDVVGEWPRPLPSTPPPLQTTYVYDRGGNLLTTLHSSVDRTIVPIDQMPKSLRNAVIAALGRANGNVARSADLLGVTRPTLYDLMHRLGLK